MAVHQHRAARITDWGWTRCVLPSGYSPYDARGRRHDDGAHGGVVFVRRCRCGAEQVVEKNGGRANYGPWEK